MLPQIATHPAFTSLAWYRCIPAIGAWSLFDYIALDLYRLVSTTITCMWRAMYRYPSRIACKALLSSAHNFLNKTWTSMLASYRLSRALPLWAAGCINVIVHDQVGAARGCFGNL